jgi:RHS repeat-associated protein
MLRKEETTMTRYSFRHYRSRLSALAIAVALAAGSSWSQRGTLGAEPPQATGPRVLGQSATLMPDGRWLLIGGLRPDGSAAPSVLVDGRGTVTPVPAALHEPRSGHSATLLPDGTVLIIGGLSRDGAVAASMERFDPASGRFEVMANAPAIGRAFHTATVVSDGRVLIAGGTDEGQHPMDDVLLLDPTMMQAPAVLATLANPRLRHDATLLADGCVRLSGGINEAGRPLSLDETVDPLTGFITRASAPDAVGELFVMASAPSSGATDVSRDVTVRLRFSTPAQVWSVNDRTATLSDDTGNLVPIAVVPVESGMLAFVRPFVRLDSGRSYSLVLDGVRASGGRRLTPLTISFTTEGASLPQPIDDEFWVPLNGLWTTGRGPSPWEQLPRLQAPQGVTAVSGQTLRLNGLPLAGVRLSIGDRTVESDRTGRFLIESAPSGRQVLLIDGRPISTPGRAYGVFEVGVDVIAGKTNGLPFTSWMARLDTQHEITISSPTTAETVIGNPAIPGLEVRLPVGTIIRDIDHQVVRKVSITAIPLDRTPFPLATGVRPPVYFTLQPGGAYLETAQGASSRGARIIYPNNLGWKPETAADFWHYDPEDRGWFVYGNGSVTRDGTRIIPDPGIGIYEFTGAMVGSPLFGPAEAPPPCGKCEDGDPVDLATGLFVYSHVDLSLEDVLPITLKRTYRTRDTRYRAFGIGAMHPYDIYIVGDTNPYTYADIRLADGGRLHYVRISAGTGFIDAVYEHTETPTPFYKSRISWNTIRQGWDLKLVDGTIYKFPDAEFASIPPQAALVGITDRFGNSIAFQRNSFGDLTKITSPNGRWIQFTYDGYDRITSAQDNIGRTVGYTYDANGNLWKVTDPKQGVTEYTYDTSHRMIDIKDPRGNIYLTNEYNISGRVIKQTMGDGGIYTFAYTTDTGGHVTRTDITDPRGFVRTVTFDSAGYWLTDTRASTKPEQQIVSVERDAATHFITRHVDGLSRVTTLGYNTSGSLTSITRLADTAHPVATTLTYEPTYQQLETVTDPLTHMTTYGHDTRGALTSITDALSHITTVTPNSAGQPASISNTAGTVTLLYDSGVFVGYVNNAGNTVSSVIDGAGRTIKRIDALGNTRTYQNDGLNRVTQVTDALNGNTVIDYDGNDNMTRVTDARNGVTQFSYDLMDRFESKTDALLRSDHFIYDRVNNVRQFTDRRGVTTTYQYDGLNRITNATFADGTSTTYSYDAANRLTQVTDSVSGTIVLGYDNLDNLTSETITRPGESTRTVSYTVDDADRRTSITVSGQPTITYGYDNADRLTSITQGTSIITIGYDDANRRSSVTFPTGNSVEYGYDGAARLASMTFKRGTTVLGDLTYQYDANGRRTEVGGSFGRLMLPQVVSGTVYNAANQLTQWNTRTLTYDLAGNLVTDGTGREFSWDARNHLEGIRGPASAAFGYDGIGRRIQKTVNGMTTAFLHDGIDVIQELVGGAPSANLVPGPYVDEVFTRTDGTGQHAIFGDGLRSTVALTTPTGDAATSYIYAPFGDTIVNGATSTNPTQFTGREVDGTGLYYYRARYYSPTLQRFTAEDPKGFAAGDVNLYSYVANDPTNASDPLGEQEILLCGRYMGMPRMIPRLVAEQAKAEGVPRVSEPPPVRPGTQPFPPTDIVRVGRAGRVINALARALEVLSGGGGRDAGPSSLADPGQPMPGAMLPQPGGKSGKNPCRVGRNGIVICEV